MLVYYYTVIFGITSKMFKGWTAEEGLGMTVDGTDRAPGWVIVELWPYRVYVGFRAEKGFRFRA